MHPPAWDCSPSQAQGAAEMHHVPIALLPPRGPLQVQVTHPTQVPTPRRYLSHAGTYFIKEAAKCWPNRKLSPANDAQLPPGSARLQKANPFLPQPVPCGDTRVVPLQHPRRSPQTPPQPFQPPRGNRTIRVMICLGRAWRTPQRCCASLVRGCAELADRSLFSDVVRGSFPFPLKMR